MSSSAKITSLTSEVRDAALQRLAVERGRVDAATVSRFPIPTYIGLFDELSGYGRYFRVPEGAARICAQIESAVGLGGLETYHRCVLLTLIAEFGERTPTPPYPTEVLVAYEAYLRSVIAQMERNPSGYYLHGNDRFAKELAVCRHKLIPCGAQVIDVRSSVPRGIARSQPGWGGLRFLSYMLGRVRGFRVLYELHMDYRLIREFNPEGWQRCFTRIARLLEQRPEVLGVFGASWWYDPALRNVSPRLDFLREIPLQGAARLFRIGPSTFNVENAIANSLERTQAYEQGRYRPADWLLVWARRDLLNWAQRGAVS